MMMGRLGPPANAKNEVSGAGLLGRIAAVSDGVTMHIDDGGRANRVNLCSSHLALTIIGCSILLILSIRRFPNRLSVRSF